MILLICFLSIVLFLGSCSDPATVYFFQTQFYSTPTLRCEEIKQTLGVYKLEVKQDSLLSEALKVIEKYGSLLEEYGPDYRILIESEGRLICSDLDLLLSLTNEIEPEDLIVISRLRDMIETNKKNAVEVVPLYKGHG